MSSPAPPTAVPSQFDPKYGRTVLLILAGMAIMVTYVETMVLPAFSNFESFFHVTEASTIAWILSAYLLVGVVVTPIFGKLGDIYGKKRMLLTTMVVYAVAVSLAGFSPNIGALFGLSRPDQIYVLITVRAIQGVGMAMFPLGFAMLPEVFPPARVGQAQGLLSGMFAAGAAAGLVGGGYIAENYGWQVTYHTVIPAAVLVIILAYVFIKESKIRLARKIDFPGIVSLGVGLTLLMLGITEGAYWGWTNFTSVSLDGISWGVPEFLILAAAAFAFFAYWEPRASSPVVSFQSLRERNILVSNINGVLVGMSMFLLFTILIILGEYPSPGFGLSELNAGLILVPAVISMLVTGPFLGRAISKYGPKPVMMLGFALITLGAFGLVAFNRSTYDVAMLGVPMLVGNVATLISMSNVIVLSVDPRTMGIQTGMNQTFRNLGSALGPVLVTSILASYLITPALGGFQNYELVGYQVVFGLVGAIGIIGLLFTVALRNFRFLKDGTRSGYPSRVPVAEPQAPKPVPVAQAAAQPAPDAPGKKKEE